MWVRGSCFSTCARPRVTLPYIHSLLDIPPTLSSYIVHTHTFIYTTTTAKLLVCILMQTRTWLETRVHGSPSLSLRFSALVAYVYACRAHVCIYMCVCGGRLRCEETTERVFGSEEDRYRPVECPGEDWTRKRTRWKQDHGCEPVSPPFRYPLCVTLSLSLPPPDLSPPSVRPRPRTLFVTGSPAPLLSLSLRVETLEHRRADSTRRPTDNQYAGRPVLSPAKSSFSHVPSFPFFPSDRFLSNLRRPTLRRSSNISPSWIYPSFFIYIYISFFFLQGSVTYLDGNSII